MTRSDTQTAHILAHLQQGHSITPIEALNEYGCFRLSAQIFKLKKRGYNITSTLIYCGNKRFSSYRLEQ